MYKWEREDILKLKNVDPFKRVQGSNVISVEKLFPKKKDGTCACGCGTPLNNKRRKWLNDEHRQECYDEVMMWKGDPNTIRFLLNVRDKGVCNDCGEAFSEWDADHIVPVYKGGGACDLSNFQTLCKECHKKKTKQDLKNEL